MSTSQIDCHQCQDPRRKGLHTCDRTDQTEDRQKVNTNHARQIFMNVLGLTREGIQEMVITTTADTVSKYFASGQFELFLGQKIDAVLKGKHLDTKGLTETITAACTSAVTKEITGKLKLDIKLDINIEGTLDGTPQT